MLGVSEEAMGWIERYSWPGNVQELEEVIKQAAARCQGLTVTPQDLLQALREQSRMPAARGQAVKRPPGGIAMADIEKHLIRQALEQAHPTSRKPPSCWGWPHPTARTAETLRSRNRLSFSPRGVFHGIKGPALRLSPATGGQRRSG